MSATLQCGRHLDKDLVKVSSQSVSKESNMHVFAPSGPVEESFPHTRSKISNLGILEGLRDER